MVAGCVAGLKFVLGMVAFANIVFNSVDNESVNDMFATGINIFLMAAVVGLLWSALFSGMNALVTPQDVPALVLSQLAALVADKVNDKSKAGQTLLAAGWAATILTGAMLVLLGRLHAGGVLRKLPAPVVSGFIATMGALAIRGAISMLSGVAFTVFWPVDSEAFRGWKPWAHLFLGLAGLANSRYMSGAVKPLVRSEGLKALVSPACLLAPLLVFYTVLFYRGQLAEDMAWMRSEGWMYPTIDVKPFYTLWWETLQIDRVEWPVLADPALAASLVVMAALTSLSAMLSIISAIPNVPCASNAGQLGGPVDIDEELVSLGNSQMLVGALTGTMPGYQQVGVSASMYQDGGTHRLAQFSTAAFVAGVLISGIPVSPYIPKFFLGAIFLNLGVNFCKTHLVDNWRRMSTPSFCSMLVIVLVGLAQGLTAAVVAGVAVQTVLMVHQASTVDPVYQCGGPDGGFISARIRGMAELQHLRCGSRQADASRGPRIEVVRLQGPIFFGVAPSLEDQAERLLRSEHALTHFVLDMAHVTQVDSSGARALANILRTARSVGTRRLALTGANELVQAALEAEGVATGSDNGGTCSSTTGLLIADQFAVMEEALEAYEDDLLGEAEVSGLVPSLRCEAPLDPTGHAGLEVLSEDQWSTILAVSSGTMRLAEGELLYAFGDPVDGFWVLLEGKVGVETMVAGKCRRAAKTISKFTAPFAVGSSAFFLGVSRHVFQMRALGEAGAVLLCLLQSDLDALEKHHPTVHTIFLTRFVAYSLAMDCMHMRWRSALNE